MVRLEITKNEFSLITTEGFCKRKKEIRDTFNLAVKENCTRSNMNNCWIIPLINGLKRAGEFYYAFSLAGPSCPQMHKCVSLLENYMDLREIEAVEYRGERPKLKGKKLYCGFYSAEELEEIFNCIEKSFHSSYLKR